MFSPKKSARALREKIAHLTVMEREIEREREREREREVGVHAFGSDAVQCTSSALAPLAIGRMHETS